MNEEPANPVIGNGDETPSESPTQEQTVVTEEGSQPEKPAQAQVPYHEDPRWIQKEQEIRELKQWREENAPLLEKLKTKSAEEVEIDPDWAELFGADPEAYKKWTSYEGKLADRILERISKDVAAKETAIKEQNAWVENELNSLRADNKQFDENELLKVMREYSPSDEEGNYDFKKGYQIYEALKKGAPDPTLPKKAVAGLSGDNGKGESNPGAVASFDTLRGNRAWN